MFDTTIWTVLIAATLTAVATGLGALPFLFVRRLSLFWVSIANAAAGGFMFAATHSLVAEGVTISPARLVAGMMIGLVGIVIGKMLIAEQERASIAGLVKLDARKAIGSKADMCTAIRHVCFAPESGHLPATQSQNCLAEFGKCYGLAKINQPRGR